MKSFLEMYVQQFKTSLAATLQYRASLVIWMIGHVLEPLVFLMVWSAVARAGGGSVGAFTPETFAAYFILLMLVNQVTFTWIMYEYEYRVRNGTLSFALLRPIHPIHSDIADNIASKLLTMPFMLIIAGILAVGFHASYTPVVWSLIAAIPSLLLGFLVRFLLEWTLALASFWTTRVSAINQVYFILVLFFSGQLAPLALYPHLIQVFASILPFRWMISFPLELLLGQLSPQQLLTGFLFQIAWLALGLLFLRFVWRAGVKVYSAVGA